MKLRLKLKPRSFDFIRSLFQAIAGALGILIVSFFIYQGMYSLLESGEWAWYYLENRPALSLDGFLEFASLFTGYPLPIRITYWSYPYWYTGAPTDLLYEPITFTAVVFLPFWIFIGTICSFVSKNWVELLLNGIAQTISIVGLTLLFRGTIYIHSVLAFCVLYISALAIHKSLREEIKNYSN